MSLVDLVLSRFLHRYDPAVQKFKLKKTYGPTEGERIIVGLYNEVDRLDKEIEVQRQKSRDVKFPAMDRMVARQRMRDLNAQRANRIGLAREVEKRIKAMYRYSVALRMRDTGARGNYYDFIGQAWTGEVDRSLEPRLLDALKRFIVDFFWRNRKATGAASKYSYKEIENWVYFTQTSDGWQEVDFSPDYLDQYLLQAEDYKTGAVLDYKRGAIKSL